MSKAKKQPAPITIPGLFIRTTFICIYKSKTENATDADGDRAFEEALNSGEIVFVRKSGLVNNMEIYQFKS